MFKIAPNYQKDSLLTQFAIKTLLDRYVMPNEGPQDLFARVAGYYADNAEHAQRLYNYISNLWFMPATPVLSNGGTDKGLPISCFLNEVQDSIDSLDTMFSENMHLAVNGGGIGTHWSNMRSMGEKIGDWGKTSGIMPFLKIVDSMTLAISQGGVRRGSVAAYLDIDHPEIDEFIDVRRPIGDPNRRSLNLHHGVVLTDAFMEAVEKGKMWKLISPKTKAVIEEVSARELWIKILTTRIETGEPYILYKDTVNKALPEVQKKLGLEVKTSNLCSEITLPTGPDHLGNERTAVCCLSSLNLEYYREWEKDANFIPDIMHFLDNVLSDFIKKAPKEMERARYSALRERSIGLGVMGFHSFLQANGLPIESVVAKSWNKRIFKHIKERCDVASIELANERGACEDGKEAGINERFTNKTAIAPTASISNICGESSPGIEPYSANAFTQKTLSGSFSVKNKNLQKLLASKGYDTDEVWGSIIVNAGSVAHLDCLTQDEKDVFKTALEINQMWLIEHAADRTPFICQSQSLNLFLRSNIHKKELHDLHFQAWKKGVKSLYYCRSASLQRPETVSKEHLKIEVAENTTPVLKEVDECLSCQ